MTETHLLYPVQYIRFAEYDSMDTRIKNALKVAGIHFLVELLAFRKFEYPVRLYNKDYGFVYNIGAGALKEIQTCLKHHGWSLGTVDVEIFKHRDRILKDIDWNGKDMTRKATVLREIIEAYPHITQRVLEQKTPRSPSNEFRIASSGIYDSRWSFVKIFLPDAICHMIDDGILKFGDELDPVIKCKTHANRATYDGSADKTVTLLLETSLLRVEDYDVSERFRTAVQEAVQENKSEITKRIGLRYGMVPG